MIKLYEKPYLDIDFDEERSLIIQTWKSFATPTQFRDGLEKSWEFIRTKKASLLLVNTRTKNDNTGWITRSLPAPLRYGLKAQAFIVGSGIADQLSLKTFKYQQEATNTQYFEDAKKAKNWLATQLLRTERNSLSY